MKTDVTLPQEGEQPEAAGEAPAAREEPKGVHLAFGRKTGGKPPFQKARTLEKRLKLFLWGDSGVGKTTLALQFPKPVMIDMEGGADLYGDAFDFEVLRATTADEIAEAVDWLLGNRHDHRTLVIDPITIYWDALQKKWSDIFLKRNKGSKGYRYEFYDLQPRDWMTIKAEFKELVRKLIALDMNVVVTAREKTKYKEGQFMVAAGETFDGEKSLPYLFDTIVRLHRDPGGRFMGTCIKDRSNKMPKDDFPVSYPLFEGLFGKEALARKAKPLAMATEEQKKAIAGFIERFNIPPEQAVKRLAAYGADGLDALTRENADLILRKFQAAAAAQAPAQESNNTQQRRA
jgi:hypothetical protein